MRIRLPLALAVLGLIAQPPAAPAAVLSGLDGMTATVFQEGQSSFSGLGLRARLRSEQLVKGIEFMPTIEYWRNSNNISPFNIEATRKDATLAMDVRYTFKSGSWKPYLGVGMGVHFLSSRVNAPQLGLDDASDSLIKGGASALAGISFPFTTRVENFIELKYHHLPGYRQLKLNWGLAWNL